MNDNVQNNSCKNNVVHRRKLDLNDNNKNNNEKNNKECSWGDNVVIKPDGYNDLDPCIYENVEIWHNVTVIVSKCKKCGKIDISWIKQENTWTDSDECNQ